MLEWVASSSALVLVLGIWADYTTIDASVMALMMVSRSRG